MKEFQYGREQCAYQQKIHPSWHKQLLISATRSILSIGARLSVTNETVSGATTSAVEFSHSMIELGVSAAVILALGITLKLLGRLTEEHEK